MRQRQQQQQQPSSLGRAGQLVLALPALFAFLCVLSLLSLLFSVLFCVFAAFGWLLWVTVRAKRSRSLHSPLSLPALLACVRTLSRSFSLFVALSRAVAILFKSFGRETLRRVCVVACQDWQQQRSSSAVGQQASSVSQSVANAAGARISTSSQATLPIESQS